MIDAIPVPLAVVLMSMLYASMFIIAALLYASMHIISAHAWKISFDMFKQTFTDQYTKHLINVHMCIYNKYMTIWK